jgi:hypothetical protein
MHKDCIQCGDNSGTVVGGAGYVPKKGYQTLKNNLASQVLNRIAKHL